MRPGTPRGGGGPRGPPPPWQRKTELCSYFDTPRGCARGQACWFAHGQHELQQPRLLLVSVLILWISCGGRVEAVSITNATTHVPPCSASAFSLLDSPRALPPYCIAGRGA